jgi:UDP-N-acetylmuramoyl-L-alanyl-D-glutamate--2,6-diaminopimelate ligase
VTVGALLEALGPPGLLAETARVPVDVASTRATGVAYDSRRATAGTIFVGLRGQQADGAAFAPQAVARGASLVVAETPAPAALDCPWVLVTDARLSIAILAAAFYDHPTRALRLAGITGTNGKTTTAYLLRSIFEAAGLPSGLLGTVVYSTGGEDRDATRTTPEAPDLEALFRDMVDRGRHAAVMEVSSHALALRRVDALHFSAGVFMNLTRDHLDFHGDMESYAAAKRRLFELLPQGAPAIVNLDDPKAAYFLEAARTPVTYALRRPADVTPVDLTLSLTGLRFDVATPAGTVRVRSSLVGRPNAYNILAAIATAVGLGLPAAAIEQGLSSLAGVPGRFEVVSSPNDDVTAIVDYAHTDDALRNLLETARAMATGRLITVFGCGGDRDRTKRPLMGAVAGRLSEVVVVTSDNPRSEEPGRIAEEIMRGMPAPSEHVVQAGGTTRTVYGPDAVTILDRRAAIEHAIKVAAPGDLVILAGKGHEKTQVIGDREIKSDDVELARGALMRRRARTKVS